MGKTDKPKFTYFFNNIYALGIFLFVVYLLFGSLYGQKLLDDHIIKNLKFMREHPTFTPDQKWKMKFGFDYEYLSQIKKNTPEDAVIWMPPDSSIAPENESTPFNTGKIGITSESWATYFLYPRTLVYDTTQADTIDYVAIVNGKGYERLPYKVDKKTEHAILPMRKIKN